MSLTGWADAIAPLVPHSPTVQLLEWSILASKQILAWFFFFPWSKDPDNKWLTFNICTDMIHLLLFGLRLFQNRRRFTHFDFFFFSSVSRACVKLFFFCSPRPANPLLSARILCGVSSCVTYVPVHNYTTFLMLWFVFSKWKEEKYSDFFALGTLQRAHPPISNTLFFFCKFTGGAKYAKAVWF